LTEGRYFPTLFGAEKRIQSVKEGGQRSGKKTVTRRELAIQTHMKEREKNIYQGGKYKQREDETFSIR